MCFHTSQTKQVVEIENFYDVELYSSELLDLFDFPFYHINGFSHPNMLIIPQEEPKKLIGAKWGIVPGNKKKNQIEDYYKESIAFGAGLNAQSEKLFNHFIYKHSAFTRKCIIPVTGFFEPHEHEKKKYPFYIHNKGHLISLAGIYSLIEDLPTFTILTKTANSFFSKIHNVKKRQPIILDDSIKNNWLKNDLSEEELKGILNFDTPNLLAHPVSKDLFSPKINSNVETILEKVTYDVVK